MNEEGRMKNEEFQSEPRYLGAYSPFPANPPWLYLRPFLPPSYSLSTAKN
jgi:hypothetical protein